MFKRIFADVHMGFTELRATSCVLEELVFLLAVRKLSIVRSCFCLTCAPEHQSLICSRLTSMQALCRLGPRSPN